MFLVLSAVVVIYGLSTYRWNFSIATGLLLVLTAKVVLALSYQPRSNQAMLGMPAAELK